jgi:hypothetical protein
VGVCGHHTKDHCGFMRHKSACAYHSPAPLHQQMHPRRIKAARRAYSSRPHNARVQSSRKNRYTLVLNTLALTLAPCWAHLRFLLCCRCACARGQRIHLAVIATFLGCVCFNQNDTNGATFLDMCAPTLVISTKRHL